MRTEIESGTHPADVAKVLQAMAGFLFYIVKTSFVNAQGKNWTGEKIIGSTGQKHIAKMLGCRVSRHPGISSQITSQAASVQHSV